VVELESWSQEPDLAVEASASLHQAAVWPLVEVCNLLRRFDLHSASFLPVVAMRGLPSEELGF
jgi:hypothetical protein